ncbi:phytanoyl-CoA dioxygenase family protein, partial [Undibacterium sp. CCC3.4]|nr:phytanoyl-CoA dioxygenase family protein [Undibacterium sp. CCC3.4]
MLSQEQLQQFQQNGYLVLPAQVDGSICEQMIAFAQQQLASHIAPIEYEADTRYPGAPVSRDAEG